MPRPRNAPCLPPPLAFDWAAARSGLSLSLALATACSGTAAPAPGAPRRERSIVVASEGQSHDAGTPRAAYVPPPFAYHVTFSDPTGALVAERASLLVAARAGLDEWGRHVTGRGTLTVELRVAQTATGRFAGASTSNVPVGRCRATPAPCTVVEEQAIRRLRAGADHPEAPGRPDVAVTIAPDYVRTQLWFDPEPARRTAAVPADRLDAISVFTHEFGHALGMTGFRSLTTYRPTTAYLSLFDDLVRVGDATLTFVGPATAARFGPLALTRTNTTQNVYHYGDPSKRGPFDDALMNGIVYRYGRRYRVTAVDLAVLSDLGVPLRRPL